MTADSINASSIDAWLETTRPRPWGTLLTRFLFRVAVVAMLVVAIAGPSFGLPQTLSLGAPGLVLMLLVLAGWVESRRRRRAQRDVFRLSQFVQLNDEASALKVLDRLLGRRFSSSHLRIQVFMQMATIAERRRQYSEAILIYERLIEEGVSDRTQLEELSLSCAAAKVHNHELTDAVTLIHRLERLPLPAGMRAACDLVQLFQQVFMGHYEDAVQNADERRALFRRHLSTRAAYGYGLLAAAMHRLGRFEEARKFWNDATTLLRPSRLIEEYAILGEVASAYPATEIPL